MICNKISIVYVRIEEEKKTRIELKKLQLIAIQINWFFASIFYVGVWFDFLVLLSISMGIECEIFLSATANEVHGNGQWHSLCPGSLYRCSYVLYERADREIEGRNDSVLYPIGVCVIESTHVHLVS